MRRRIASALRGLCLLNSKWAYQKGNVGLRRTNADRYGRTGHLIATTPLERLPVHIWDLVLPMLQLRIVRLVLLTLLAFGAVSTVFNTAVTAQTQQDLPKTIPNLSGFDSQTQQSIELACISEKMKGRATYGACLNRQIASLQSSPGIPSLNGYDPETQQSIGLACISEKVKGPVAYGACLNRQIASLQSSPGIPSLNGHDPKTQQSIGLACISEKVKGPVAYGACLNRHLASLQGSPSSPNPIGNDSPTRQTALPATNSGGAKPDKPKSKGTAVASVSPMSKFTSEKIVKIHSGMESNEILEFFGAPKISASKCVELWWVNLGLARYGSTETLFLSGQHSSLMMKAAL